MGKYLIAAMVFVSANTYAQCETQIVVIDGKTYACFICPKFTQCERT